MPILVLNNDMNIEFVSDSAYRYFDIIRGLEKDTKVSDLFSLDANVDIEEIINKCITVDCYIKNSENYCSIFVDLIKDTFDDIIGYVMIITDLTEKHKKDTVLLDIYWKIVYNDYKQEVDRSTLCFLHFY